MRKLLFILPIWLCLVIISPSYAHAIKIVVDAGHGGSDPGAIGINGLNEKDITLDIALKLQDQLVKRDYEVVLSRTDDRFISLQDRVDYTNKQSADLFISIHGNSYPSSQAKGTLVLYYDNQFPQSSYPASAQMESLTPISKAFAQQVLDAFINKLHTENQDIVPSSVYVVRNGTIPSVLIETAFLSNPEDAALLADPIVRSQMAEAIADGIQAFRPLPAKLAFTDINGHWAKDAILSLNEKGIVTGENHLYYPDRSLSRAELLTLLDRIHPFESLSEGYEKAVFSDLNEQHWAYPTFEKAIAAGYIRGYDDGSIKPDQAVSRGEAAALIDQFVEKTEPAPSTDGAAPQIDEGITDVPAAFTDVSADSWYAPAINHLRSLGILTGKTPDLFAPNKTITRAEIAALLDRWTDKNR
ncbi:N-acetylmuramoyl-L-alanine amidase [Paenibacillus psychroresistens]|uniref:N-acetylmuramoyl-L-alanine amidase n=1 Tax=Paenibacillus psychroresistens TaxID=1778678 RepID=A0A6B8RJ90_9BACL|nr:N-acetylmuramoyl-L-alanine amidase [Paenibacillus psychroresistens]QGQ95388.1 N-acetylmuramoyl-L-alanine amidase [Paenibacillus psychroresistens]